MQKYGQHFLVNQGIIDKITGALIDNQEGSLIEIGPGKGALTFNLLNKGINDFTLVEIDPKMSEFLKQNLPAWATYKLIEKDFLTLTETDFPEGKKTFLSNLPYIDAAQILLKVLDLPGFACAVFMFQREQARKFFATPETKLYGPLSIMVQARANVQSVCRVSPGSFNPPPKVDSEVVLIKPKEKTFFVSAEHKKNFDELVKCAFIYRRKTILNALSEVYKKNKDDLIKILAKSNIKVSARAEELSPRHYADLAQNLKGLIF